MFSSIMVAITLEPLMLATFIPPVASASEITIVSPPANPWPKWVTSTVVVPLIVLNGFTTARRTCVVPTTLPVADVADWTLTISISVS